MYRYADSDQKNRLPKKVENGLLDDALSYCTQLIETLEADEVLCSMPSILEKLNLLREITEDSAEHLAEAKDKDARGYHLWAAMEQSGMTVKSGSYSDMQGYGLAVGWTRELGRKGHTLLFSPFVEYGRGKYDSYLDDGVHGSGKISYLGVGVMGTARRQDAQRLQRLALYGDELALRQLERVLCGTSGHWQGDEDQRERPTEHLSAVLLVVPVGDAGKNPYGRTECKRR